MTTLTLADEFAATHRIRIDARGTLEPLHAHNWRIRAALRAPDATAGEAARATFAAWVERHRGRCFNDVPPFDRVNPTAEEVARVLAAEIEAAAPGLVAERVEVGEAAGFSAAYYPHGDPPSGDALSPSR